MDPRDEKELDTVLRKAMADLDPDERAVRYAGRQASQVTRSLTATAGPQTQPRLRSNASGKAFGGALVIDLAILASVGMQDWKLEPRHGPAGNSGQGATAFLAFTATVVF